MKHSVTVLIAMVTTALSSQITFEPLGEVIPWAGAIMEGEITEYEITRSDTRITVDLTLDVHDVLVGDFSDEDWINCTYTIPVPEILDESGEVIGTISFSVNGSGLEFHAAEGDTVIILIEPHAPPAGTVCNLVRLETTEARKDILFHLLESGRIEGY